MNALTVSVNYDDLLAITLPRMAAVFDRVCVVTDLHDYDTLLIAESHDNVFAHQTDAFTRNGATFNKGLAQEEGLDILGRRGWICCIDSDILLPKSIHFGDLEPGCLYGAKRRLCDEPQRWMEPWDQWPIILDSELGGFLHVFHADDKVLKRQPWYGIDWRHAGGCDSQFEARWPRNRKVRLPLEVLHLGPLKLNWWGRQSARMDGKPLPNAKRAGNLMDEMIRRRTARDGHWERLRPDRMSPNNS